MKFKMKNSTYDVLKRIVMVYAPAAVTLWLTLGDIWGFPYLNEIAASATAVIVFLGVCLGISSENYQLDAYHEEPIYEADPDEED